MPQSFQVILQVQIPIVMRGACCQISWLEELSVLLPGWPLGLYNILQAIQEASVTIASSPRVQQQLGHTPALALNAASLSFSAATAMPSLTQTCSQFFLHFLLLSCFVIVPVFWLVTPLLLSHQPPLSTVAPSGHATLHCTSWYPVPLLCLFNLFIAELFIFLHRT